MRLISLQSHFGVQWKHLHESAPKRVLKLGTLLPNYRILSHYRKFCKTQQDFNDTNEYLVQVILSVVNKIGFL